MMNGQLPDPYRIKAIAAQDSCVRRTGGAGLIFTRTIAWLLSFTPKAHLIFDNNTEVEPFAKDIF